MPDTIKIQLKDEMLADFFAGIFQASHRGIIKVSRKHDVGKFIYSLVRYSDTKLPEFTKSNPKFCVVDICLPDTTFTTADYKYPYITKEDQFKINDYISSFFNQQLRSYIIMGQELKLMQKNSIEIFMTVYRLDPVKHSGLVKKDYRWRMDVKEKIQEIAKEFGM